jgi:hypothetical protein
MRFTTYPHGWPSAASAPPPLAPAPDPGIIIGFIIGELDEAPIIGEPPMGMFMYGLLM